jgi:uncharacterized protein (DUF2267 family)
MNKIELLKNHIKEVIHNRFLGNPGQDIDINIAEEAIKEFDNFVESQKDLIKGKDEYIARLLNQNKELRDKNKELVARNAFRILTTEDSISEKAIEQFKERFEKMSPIIGTNNIEIEYNGYKAIEQELEVEFLTIQKLRKANHIYVNSDGNIRRLSYPNIRIDDESVFINGDLDIEEKGYVEEDFIFEIKDKEYGKTWAFTKEELELL